MKRAPRRARSAYRRRPRDLAYMAWVRRQPCAIRLLTRDELIAIGMTPSGALEFGRDRCDGRVEADHAGRRPGIGLKADDRTCIPLCQMHHAARGHFHGVFRYWTGRLMRDWLDVVIGKIQQCHADQAPCPR